MILINKNYYVDGFTFPGGERHVNVQHIPEAIHYNIEVIIKKSDDLMDLILTCDALKYKYPKTPINLLMAYIPYARQDRRCNLGDPCSIKVLAKIIDSLGCSQVIVFDPHNCEPIKKIINNIRILDNVNFISKILADENFDFLVCPDDGAIDRYDKIWYKKPTVYCSKIRDPITGKLSGFAINKDKTSYTNKRYFDTSNMIYDFIENSCNNGLIVDDICDGGGTFLGLAELFSSKLSLAVSHGIFSKGLESLLEKFDKIFTTNSWCQILANDHLKVYNWNHIDG